MPSKPVEHAPVELQKEVGPTTGETNVVSRINLASESLSRTMAQEPGPSIPVQATRAVETSKSQSEPKEIPSLVAATSVVDILVSEGFKEVDTSKTSEFNISTQTVVKTFASEGDTSLISEFQQTDSLAPIIE